MLEIKILKKGNIIAADQSTKDILKRSFFGMEVDSELKLMPEEAMYLVDLRNAECTYKDKKITFNSIAMLFKKKKKLMASYFTYKDWRDRGLIARSFDIAYKSPDKTPVKAYPSSSIELPKWKVGGVFFEEDLITVIEDSDKGKEIYEKLWFGQYGSYKAPERGKLNKLDIYETVFLMERKKLALQGVKLAEVIKLAKQRRSDFSMMYEVYRDWRDNGYVVKTGFKFGTHFRIYFPGARPVKDSNWIHSKHVLQVFPKSSKLLISEWARAIRVAHSVRKTFILAIPGKVKEKKMKLDYVLYHRKGGEAESPENNVPKYGMLSLSEEEYIGGKELAGAIKEAKDKKLELIIAIADRETAITYYKVRQIELPGSGHEYYEIDWMQP
ncbi:MAG: tRNA-intron lyase [Candidatus Micrarchaeia archaeon]